MIDSKISQEVNSREIKKIQKKLLSINLMYLPALVLFLLFVIYPFLVGIKISFTNWNGFSQSYKFVGLRNYIDLFKDKNIFTAFINTVIYGLGSTFVQQVIGLALAILLNKKFKGRNFARTIIYLPVLIAPVIMGYMWYFIFQYDGGALNDMMQWLNYPLKDWLTLGKGTVWLMVLINSLQFVGISMVIYLAGLQSISDMYYEAARIDGASAWDQFKNITIPLLMPAITTSVTINVIGGLKLFDVIMALTAGGPGYSTHSLSTIINYTYFNTQNAGYASAIGLFLFSFIMIVSLYLQNYFSQKEVEY